MLSVDTDIRRLMALRAIESCLLRLKWLAAATRFESAMHRHDRALRYAYKAGFNPNQPRDEIGRWTDTGAGQRVQLSSSDTPRLGPKSKLAIAIEVARQAMKLFRDRNLLHDMFGQKKGPLPTQK